jgi:hypothetical protein
VLDADPNDTIAYLTAVRNIVSSVPYADFHVGDKMRFTATTLTIKRFEDTGKIVTKRYRLDKDAPYEWEARMK